MKSLVISFFAALFAGGLYALTYPSFLGGGWMPLLFIALPFFLWHLEKQKTWPQLALVIFGYNLGLNITGYYWIPHTLREFGQLPWIVSVILGGLFAFILQPHWWAYSLWRRFRPQWRWDSEKGVLVTVGIITFLERYFPQQFPSFAGSPWLHMAPYLSLAPVLGVVAFSFITYWVAMETIVQLKLRSFRPQVWIALALFVVVNAVFPLQGPPEIRKLNVRFVQANIGNFLKVESERGESNSYESIAKKYFQLSVEDNGFSPDLIVWPETAWPNAFYGHRTELNEIFDQIMERTGAELLIGGYDQDLNKSPEKLYESVFNSSILLSENRFKSAYHKNILIPFGETLPFGPFNEQVVSIVPAVSLFARGHGTPLMETKDGLRFVTPICYEVLESNYMRGLLNQWKDNHFIVNHTNDSWYGDTAEPHQHLFLAKWRALEFNLPLLRSTNTGITSVIFPDGSESRRLGVGEEDQLDVSVPIGKGQNTVYQLYGALPMFGIFLVLLLISWMREKNETRP